MGTLDLFCGAGGMSLGFNRAGYDVIAGVDYDENAIETYEKNHDARAIEENLAELTPAEFAEKYDIHPEDVEGVCGGPPCQGFTIANSNRSPDDERNNLVFVFADYVEYYDPDFFVMENVTGFATMEDGEILELLLDEFETAGYIVGWNVLDAADFGVPQHRERVIVQGKKCGSVEWPEPTYGVEA